MREGRNWGGASLVLPAFVLVAAFLLAPLALILRYSFDLHDPIKLINVYRHRGYKYTWLNDTVILLTKRVRNSPKGTTA